MQIVSWGDNLHEMSKFMNKQFAWKALIYFLEKNQNVVYRYFTQHAKR